MGRREGTMLAEIYKWFTEGFDSIETQRRQGTTRWINRFGMTVSHLASRPIWKVRDAHRATDGPIIRLLFGAVAKCAFFTFPKLIDVSSP